MPEVRVLGVGDEPLFFSFLEKHLESSIFLVSNAERAGLVDRGEPLQATYAAAIEGADITAVAAHAWNGNLLVQGGAGLEAAAELATRTSGRPIKGIVGPSDLVRRARSALRLDDAPVARDLADRLFVLELARLLVPELLGDRDIAFRAPTEAEVGETLGRWRAAYHVEVLGAKRTPELEAQALREMNGWRRAGNAWVLLRRGELLSLTGFSAKARGIVQVGGVYTPPEFRRNGFARAAVAASLLLARDEGATRSTLFTEAENAGAVRAYTALGFEPIGDFSLLLLR